MYPKYNLYLQYSMVLRVKPQNFEECLILYMSLCVQTSKESQNHGCIHLTPNH